MRENVHFQLPRPHADEVVAVRLATLVRGCVIPSLTGLGMIGDVAVGGSFNQRSTCGL
jgi:hypothetical protein